jgi:putative membrane protein
MADLVQPVRDGRIADGLVDAIGDVGVLLAQHLPRASDDVNELPDRMIHL